MIISLIGMGLISSVHFPKLLQWLYHQYHYIDDQLEKKQVQIRLAKTAWLSMLGYILEFFKGVMVPWAIENYVYYTDNLMSVCFVVILTLYIWNPLYKFKPRNHDWIVLFSGVLYFLSPVAPLYFLITLGIVLVLTNSLPWAYISAIVVSGIVINTTVILPVYLFYFLTALLPLSLILSIQLYQFHTLRKGTLTALIKR
jgi:hypothetical protein